MIGLNHAATGILLAVTVNKPLLAIPLAFASHFAIDALPHWDYKMPNNFVSRQAVMAVDLVFSTALILVLALLIFTPSWLVITAGFAAILPDAMWLPNILYGKKSPTQPNSWINKLRSFHNKIQWSESTAGLGFEAAWFVFVMTALLLVIA